jgi:hypothetical protein
MAAMSFIVIPAAWAEEAEGPNPDVPELKVLDRWVGAWTFEFSSAKAKYQPEAVRATGTETARWTLKGRFLERKATSELGEGLNLETYDPQRKAYRGWFFGSGGVTVENRGAWDAASKTLTSTPTSLDGGLTGTATTRYIDADHIEWEQVLKDASGAVVLHQQAKWTRRKSVL